jgi:hypothetical protein
VFWQAVGDLGYSNIIIYNRFRVKRYLIRSTLKPSLIELILLIIAVANRIDTVADIIKSVVLAMLLSPVDNTYCMNRAKC